MLSTNCSTWNNFEFSCRNGYTARKVYTMVISGEVIGYKIFQSGAAQIFVSTPAKDGEKCRSGGLIIYPIWQAKGTYNFSDPPHLLGASVKAFVGQNESGVIEITLKGGGI